MAKGRPDFKSDAAFFLYRLLRACFGTVMVEPAKWCFDLAKAPGRGYFSDRIAGKSKLVFDDGSIAMLDVLFEHALQLTPSLTDYDECRVCNALVDFLNEEGWADCSRFRNLGVDKELDARRRRRIHALVCEVFRALAGIEDFDTGLDDRMRARLADIVGRMEADEKGRVDGIAPVGQSGGSLSISCADASVDLLMRGLPFDDEPNFLSARTEQMVWKGLCNLYCGGTRVDDVIGAGLEACSFDAFEPEVGLFMTYYLAKFDLKRGRVKLSDSHLGQVKRGLEKADPLCSRRLGALADIRLLTNAPKATRAHALDFDERLGTLQDLPCADDQYKAYESASAIGAEATNLIAGFQPGDEAFACRLKTLAEKHERLVARYPKALGNQEVVAVSLRWFIELARLGHGGCVRASGLMELAAIGLEASRRRRNSLFHIQCVIVVGICFACEDRDAAFSAVAVLTGMLMEAFGVEPGQEGVCQLMAYLGCVDEAKRKAMLRPYREALLEMEALGNPVLSRTLLLLQPYERALASFKRVYAVDLLQELARLGLLE